MELTRRSRCFHFGVRNYEATRLDLGTESVVAIFASIAGLNNYTLSIYNWTGNTLWSGSPGGGQDQVYIGSSITPSELQQISFYSGIDPTASSPMPGNSPPTRSSPSQNPPPSSQRPSWRSSAAG